MSDMHRNTIECESLETPADLRQAMCSAIRRLAGDGWRVESDYPFGFVFLQRAGGRALFMTDRRRLSERERRRVRVFGRIWGQGCRGYVNYADSPQRLADFTFCASRASCSRSTELRAKRYLIAVAIWLSTAGFAPMKVVSRTNVNKP